MASSKVVTTNQDLPRHSSSSSSSSSSSASSSLSSLSSTSMCSLSTLLADLHHSHPSDSKNITIMDDLLNPKTVDEVWKDMVSANANGNGTHSQSQSQSQSHAHAEEEEEEEEEMTLENFLIKAAAEAAGDVTDRHNDFVTGVPSSSSLLPVINTEGSSVEPSRNVNGNGNGIEGNTLVAGGAGRGKRRVVEEPVDKATLQKQRRMIKNRESAARSRERKQAYTVELESLVTQLEEENARLLREEDEQNKQRFKQLMEYLIPVVEKRKPRRMLRRVNSVQW